MEQNLGDENQGNRAKATKSSVPTTRNFTHNTRKSCCAALQDLTLLQVAGTGGL
jgi:hypothetical protein